MKGRYVKTYINFYRYLLNKRNKFEYYVFISRKCFHYTAILSNNFKDFEPSVLLRDRDIMQEIDFSEFKDKKILLVDDTVHEGNTLLKVIERLKSRGVSEKQIGIAAFAITPQTFERVWHSQFDRMTKYFMDLFTEDELSRFVMEELKEIHEDMRSYEIDLPVFEKYTMDYEVFEKLIKEKNLGWEFNPYEVKIQEKIFLNGFFDYSNDLLKNKFGNDLLALVVKCRYQIYNTDLGEKVDCVFTPFAIMRTISYSMAKKYFDVLYADTQYCQLIHNALKYNETEDCHVDLYRGIVYQLSYCIGLIFKEYLGNRYNIILDWNNENEESRKLSSMVKDVKQTFKDSINMVFCNFSFRKYYESRLFNIEYAQENKKEWGTGRFKSDYLSEVVECWLMSRLAMQKRNLMLNRKDTYERIDVMVSLEWIEKELLSVFSFDSEKQFKTCFLRVLLKMLDSAFLSNDIKREKDKIIRCFNFAETSNIFLGYDYKAFYAAVYAYYNFNEMSYDEYRKRYETFVKKLRSFFDEKSYFEKNYITVDAFNFCATYFNINNKYVLREEIANKRYILKKSLGEEELYIKEIFEFVFEFFDVKEIIYG